MHDVISIAQVDDPVDHEGSGLDADLLLIPALGDGGADFACPEDLEVGRVALRDILLRREVGVESVRVRVEPFLLQAASCPAS
jgi:hypothetical protein